MVRLFGLSLSWLAVFSLIGGHWAILQTVAWTQMLRDYSRESNIAAAVEKTFGGKAPCAMCTKIAEERQKQEQAPATIKMDKKSEGFPVSIAHSSLRPNAVGFSHPLEPEQALAPRSDAPPVPVPISRA